MEVSVAKSETFHFRKGDLGFKTKLKIRSENNYFLKICDRTQT